MIPLYKLGGDWKKDGVEYTVEIVHSAAALKKHLSNGWVRSFSELKGKPVDNKAGEEMSERGRFLRDEIEKLTGKKPGGRSSIESLEAKYAEIEGE